MERRRRAASATLDVSETDDEADDAFKPCEGSHWHGERVRINKESPFEGCVGRVDSVLQRDGSEPPELKFKLRLFEGKSFSITVEAKDVEPKEIDYPDPAPSELDWSKVPKARRVELVEQTAIREVEPIEDGTMLELGTVGAILAEVQERILGFDALEGVVIVPPQIALLLARGDESLEADERWRELIERIAKAKHAYIVLHDEGPPRHHTLVEIHASDEGRAVVYKDSLRDYSKSSKETATRILRRIGIEAQCPRPSNELHQDDAWTCGVWCARWV